MRIKARFLQLHINFITPYSIENTVWWLRQYFKKVSLAEDKIEKEKNPKYARQVSYSQHSCCVATYILYHMFGRDSLWVPYMLENSPYFTGPHYYLRFAPTGEWFDITADQFDEFPQSEYNRGRQALEFVSKAYKPALAISSQLGVNLRDGIDL